MPQGLAGKVGRWQIAAMRIWLAALLLCFCAGAASAQTILTLSAIGNTVTQPDQITASLTAQMQAPAAAAAQAALNRLMAKALAEVNQVNGVKAVTGGYNVAELDPGNSAKPQYQASQDVALTMAAPGGAPPAAFTALTGQLQAQGLLLESLSGGLSAAGEDAARAAATVDGIHRLQAQAEAAAQALGLAVGSINSVTISGNSPGPMPMRMMAAMAAPAPQIASGPVTVSVTIDATVALKPPGG